MKTKFAFPVATALLALSTLIPQFSTAFGQGTAFTYQGRLTDSGTAPTGSYDFQFALFDLVGGGSQQGGTVAADDLSVTNGLFTVQLDFTGAPFDGSERYLEIRVRPGASTGAYTNLSPRQPITSTPHAIRAANLSGTLGSNQLAGSYGSAVTFANGANAFTGTFSGNGTGLSDVNAATLGGLTSGAFWQLGGNAGTTPGTHFLGTTDNKPLDVKVNGLRSLRLEDNGDSARDGNAEPDGAPNVIAGSPANSVAGGIVGATISGGGATNHTGLARPNFVAADFASISGGMQNTIQPGAYFAIIGGGEGNTIQSAAEHALIGGGAGNTIHATAERAVIGGGEQNVIQSNVTAATIAGGYFNRIQSGASYAIIAGGDGNTVESNAINATIGGGEQNMIQRNSLFATVGGGYANFVHVDAHYATVPGGYINRIHSNAAFAVIGGGGQNTVRTNAIYSTIGGGYLNAVENDSRYSSIGGGIGNMIQSNAVHAAIGGGSSNTIQFSNNFGTIGGGRGNTLPAAADYGTIPGGYLNSATNYAFAAGNRAKANHTGSFVWADSQNADFSSTSNNQFLIRATGGVGIGTASPGARLEVRTPDTSGNAIRFGWTQPGGTGNLIAGVSRVSIATDNLVERLSILQSSGNVGIGLTGPAFQLQLAADSAGKPNGGSWANSSDARVKKDIQPLGGAVDKLTQLRGVSFEWVNPADHANQTGRQAGFIAQEVERVFPHWVQEVPGAGRDAALTPDGRIKSLTLPFEFDALVVEALKEQQLQIKARDAEIGELKRELAELKRLLLPLVAKRN